MKQTITMYAGAIFLTLMLAFGVLLVPVYAHNGVDHSEEDTTKTLSITEMEQMITLMQQLITLLTTLKALPPAVVVVDDHSHDVAEVEMETHHDEHSAETTTDDADVEDEAKLVIEVEPHNNQTHVHVRYVDKPEEMFFVNAGLDDEDAIVSETSSRTGLSQDEVRDALKYMQ